MPIHNLTRPDDFDPAKLRVIADLHKGTARKEATNSKGEKVLIQGDELPYFRVSFNPVVGDVRAAADHFAALFGSEPKQVDGVQLIASTPDTAFPNFMMEFGSNRGLLRICDGETQLSYYVPKLARNLTDPIPCVMHETPDKPCGCKATGRLLFHIPAFVDASGIVGLFRLTVRNPNDIGEIWRELHANYLMFGDLQALRWTIGRRETDKTTPPYKNKNGEWTRGLKHTYPVYVIPDSMAVKMLLAGGEIDAPQLSPGEVALSAGNVEEEDYDVSGDDISPAEQPTDDSGPLPVPDGAHAVQYTVSDIILTPIRTKQGEDGEQGFSYTLPTMEGPALILWESPLLRRAGIDVDKYKAMKPRQKYPLGATYLATAYEKVTDGKQTWVTTDILEIPF